MLKCSPVYIFLTTNKIVFNFVSRWIAGKRLQNLRSKFYRLSSCNYVVVSNLCYCSILLNYPTKSLVTFPKGNCLAIVFTLGKIGKSDANFKFSIYDFVFSKISFTFVL